MSDPQPLVENSEFASEFIREEITRIREELEKQVALLSKNNSDVLFAVANAKEELRAIEERVHEQKEILDLL